MTRDSDNSGGGLEIVLAADGRTREHWWLARLVWAIPVVFVLLALTLTPDPSGVGTHRQLGLPACGVREWIGVPCPGCGVTTSVVELAHGHPIRSFVVQPFGFLLALAMPLFFLFVLWAHWKGRDAWLMLALGVPDRWVRVFLLAALFGWIWKILASEWSVGGL